MQSTGIIRPVDRMGRIVIPKEIRKQLNIRNDIDSLEIYMDGENIVLRKYQPTCVFCDNFADGIQFEGCFVCNNCIEKLKMQKDESQE